MWKDYPETKDPPNKEVPVAIVRQQDAVDCHGHLQEAHAVATLLGAEDEAKMIKKGMDVLLKPKQLLTHTGPNEPQGAIFSHLAAIVILAALKSAARVWDFHTNFHDRLHYSYGMAEIFRRHAFAHHDHTKPFLDGLDEITIAVRDL